MKKLAVLFPGMGYTCMKPLLYYADELCCELGYETIRLDYGEGISKDKLKAFSIASERVLPKVLGIPFEEYDDVVFIGKSIGTVIAGAAWEKISDGKTSCKKIYGEKAACVTAAVNGSLPKLRCVFLTPVPETTEHMHGNGIALSGSADPWAPDHEAMRKACEEKAVPFYSFPNANHSLETGDVQRDLDNVKRGMDIIRRYIEGDLSMVN